MTIVESRRQTPGRVVKGGGQSASSPEKEPPPSSAADSDQAGPGQDTVGQHSNHRLGYYRQQ